MCNINDNELKKAAYYVKVLGKRRGPKEKVLSDPIAEERRLKVNEASRKYKLKKRMLAKQEEKVYDEIIGIDSGDKFGIRAVDERRYTKCFHSGYVGDIPSRTYVRRMTGLSLKQIQVLQKRTGLKPVPAVTNAEATSDEIRRYETGDIY